MIMEEVMMGDGKGAGKQKPKEGSYMLWQKQNPTCRGDGSPAMPCRGATLTQQALQATQLFKKIKVQWTAHNTDNNTDRKCRRVRLRAAPLYHAVVKPEEGGWRSRAEHRTAIPKTSLG